MTTDGPSPNRPSGGAPRSNIPRIPRSTPPPPAALIPHAEGTLPNGVLFQIVTARSQALVAGAHLVASGPEELTYAHDSKPDKWGLLPIDHDRLGLLDTLLRFACGRSDGLSQLTPSSIRLAINGGKLATKPHAHVHCFLPGESEASSAPTIRAGWCSGSGAGACPRQRMTISDGGPIPFERLLAAWHTTEREAPPNLVESAPRNSLRYFSWQDLPAGAQGIHLELVLMAPLAKVSESRGLQLDLLDLVRRGMRFADAVGGLENGYRLQVDLGALTLTDRSSVHLLVLGPGETLSRLVDPWTKPLAA